MAILECVHTHITLELQQGARTDAIVVVTTVLFDLIILGVNSAVAVASATAANDRVNQVERKHIARLQQEQHKRHAEACAKKWHKGNECSKAMLERMVLELVIPSSIRRMKSDFYFVVFLLMTLLINSVCIAALLTNRDTRVKLLNGLMAMYKDQNVDAYYDASLLNNYARRYQYFALVVVALAVMAFLVPLAIRFLWTAR